MIKMEIIGNYFNSIKVRLELNADTLKGEEDGNFNSIKVRLELRNTFCSHALMVNFNSIKVRLEPTFVQ